MFKKLAFVGLLVITPMVLFAQENSIKIVALVLTTAEYNPGSDNIVKSLESLDAQVLRVESPNASEMRSILKRFSSAALDNDVALVFVDAPILKLGERRFLAPAGLNLRRSSDLLTRAIPVSALARATTLARNGGAVFVHSINLGKTLPAGVELTQVAPEALPGTSPVLVGQAGSAMALANIFDEHTQKMSMDLNSLLNDLTTRIEFSVSYIPGKSVALNRMSMEMPLDQEPDNGASSPDDPAGGPIAPGAEAGGEDAPASVEGLNLPQIQTQPAPGTLDPQEPVETADDLQEPVIETVQIDEPKPLSLDILAAIQSGLSRSEKREIQRHLRERGYYRGLIDGIFGNQTKYAIEAFQEALGEEITGILSVSQREIINN